MKYPQHSGDSRTRKAPGLRVAAFPSAPDRLGMPVVLSLIIVILLITGMRGLLT